ncbi:sigma-70 family RNA polymerase sigma factor [Nostocoides sp. HKS02]|uniref:sigma-70 family RNA polymerase sigma factor n=1 Tax=Nostocoides sp. HKS02 TaxID=1813880 RepID=UPI001E406968|nr:sigma-70 family RNA polymerase sigma factor [Tetrasphaera sp. HKS02]
MGSFDLETACRDHLPIVHYEVRSLSARLPGHVALDDLTSAGLGALVAAARSFDPHLGVPFGRYAARRIRGALLDELRSMDWASRSLRARARERETHREALTGTLHREPHEHELASAMGASVEELHELRRDLHRSVVLRIDAVGADGDADDLLPHTTQTPESVVVEQERRTYLLAAVEALPERLRSVVRGTFFEDRSVREVAEELGVTESRVSQLRTEALGLLRDGLNTNLDPELVPARTDGVVARRRAAYYAEIAGRASHAHRRTGGVRGSHSPVHAVGE